MGNSVPLHYQWEFQVCAYMHTYGFVEFKHNTRDKKKSKPTMPKSDCHGYLVYIRHKINHLKVYTPIE